MTGAPAFGRPTSGRTFEDTRKEKENEKDLETLFLKCRDNHHFSKSSASDALLADVQIVREFI